MAYLFEVFSFYIRTFHSRHVCMPILQDDDVANFYELPVKVSQLEYSRVNSQFSWAWPFRVDDFSSQAFEVEGLTTYPYEWS